MEGQVEVVVSFKPDRLFWRNVPKGSTKTEIVMLEGQKADQVKLSEITSNKPDELKAELIDQNGRKALKVTFTAAAEEGRFSGQLTAKTGLDKPAELSLWVSAQITGDLVIDRNYALFAPYDEKTPPNFEIKITSLSEKPFAVTKVEDPTGVVSGKAEKTKSGYTVSLTLTKEPAHNRGTVLLHTDRADQKTLSVNYSVRGKAGSMPGAIRPGMAPSKHGGPMNLNVRPLKPGKGPMRIQNLPGSRKMPPLTRKAPAAVQANPSK